MWKQAVVAGTVLLFLSAQKAADVSAERYELAAARAIAAAQTQYLGPAHKGHPGAQYMMGRLYAEGRGLPTDLVEAHAWYDIAASNGYWQALAASEELASRMTEAEIAEAEQRAQLWLMDKRSMAEHAKELQSHAVNPGGTVVPLPAIPPYSIAAVQTALMALGYAAGPADGLFGPKTRAMIAAYEADAGLPVTGLANRALHQRLQQALHQPSVVSPTPVEGVAAAVIAPPQIAEAE